MRYYDYAQIKKTDPTWRITWEITWEITSPITPRIEMRIAYKLINDSRRIK